MFYKVIKTPDADHFPVGCVVEAERLGDFYAANRGDRTFSFTPEELEPITTAHICDNLTDHEFQLGERVTYLSGAKWTNGTDYWFLCPRDLEVMP